MGVPTRRPHLLLKSNYIRMKKLLFLLLFITFLAKADDGYRLWLKYDKITNAKQLAEYKQFSNGIVSLFGNRNTAIIDAAHAELTKGLEGLLAKKIVNSTATKGYIILKKDPNTALDGYNIFAKNGNIEITASTETGILYGSFELLRQMQQGASLAKINLSSAPKVGLRMLNHWDNVLGTIERGYAGSSLWKWYELPETLDPRYTDYARANASIGINAVSLNNVNASPRFLTDEYIPKVKALADVFRPYGIKVYLSLNFASPKILGRLKTSDPLDPEVIKFWQEKTQKIYAAIPDFGGYLVKANSEGEPGPQEYGRNHADGANMLAKLLKPHGGRVIWRAFVYSPNPNGDRFKEAYNEFKPLDGQFDGNVIVQVKNGPIDFMPREPFHPLFGAMPKTPLAIEFQITQEYLGQSTNLVFLPTMYKEVINAVNSPSSRERVVGAEANYLQTPPLGAGANGLVAYVGVANTGSDRNWTGHFMSQANWYGFGRQAWNPDIAPEQIADEWIAQTMTKNTSTAQIIKKLLLQSHENYVNFTYPLGLAHMMGQGIHWGPEPWLERSQRPDWTSIYYHRADSLGLGFDRTATGSNALSLYSPDVQAAWSNPETCDLRYLMWFHHLAWGKKLSTGRSLWEELCHRYYTGADKMLEVQADWQSLKGKIDPQIHADVAGRLARQRAEALLWRDACVLYFQTYAKQPIPAQYPKPSRSLADVKEIVRIYQMR
jgi:alpha-glucuronidase